MSFPYVTRRRFAVVVAALTASACLSPTLPLPPPSRPTVEGPDAAGNVRLTGRVPARSRVTAQNVRTSLISGQHTPESGRYDFVIGAEPGDEIVFWYTRSNVASPTVVVVVDEPTPDDPTGMGGAGGASSGE